MISSLNLRRDHGSPAADSKSDSFSTSSLASRAKPDIARCSSVRLLETRSGTTAADAHVKVLETRLAEKENGLPGLHPHRGGLHNVHRLSIDTNISFASCNCGNSGGVLLATKGLH